ncbi:ubiquitin-like small modifier protein 1 [Natrarchaeobaculum aegyptiacum]|uniref:Molybdopterin synthase sulfur carrier subunit n=1 Tax=Natrarchaeobaculum aegyptiacum TaxID=745377 RepID=A0A2Z2HY90_9EURY|nr:ubiquitin-like small modifier protein 1 [Natrarchaeobaculum aegyptiacum]ARS90707.1 molybdopterin synthase sulfur carrier subunit [Natrarchaeobaculum aegyptiacum]
MEVTVYGPLRSATGDKQVRVAFEGRTVHEALEALVEAYPRAEQYLYRHDGTLASSVRISIAGERVDLDDPCPADAEVTVHPAVQGG